MFKSNKIALLFMQIFLLALGSEFAHTTAPIVKEAATETNEAIWTKNIKSIKTGCRLMSKALNKTLPSKERSAAKKRLRTWLENDDVPSPEFVMANDGYTASEFKRVVKNIVEGLDDPQQRFKAKLDLAVLYAVNSCHDKTSIANPKAHKIFKELLADKLLPLENRIAVRMELARLYLCVRAHFAPENPKDIHSVVMKLYNEILNDPELPQERCFEIKCDLANQHDGTGAADQLRISHDKAKAEMLRIYQEVVDDKRTTAEQKVKVEKIIAWYKNGSPSDSSPF